MGEAASGALISVGVVRRLPKKKTGLAANAGPKAVHPPRCPSNEYPDCKKPAPEPRYRHQGYLPKMKLHY